jgi:hypothetical protein
MIIVSFIEIYQDSWFRYKQITVPLKPIGFLIKFLYCRQVIPLVQARVAIPFGVESLMMK